MAFSSTVSLPGLVSAVTMSGSGLASKLPVATSFAPSALKLSGVENVPLPWPGSTKTALPSWSVVARSSTESALKSATANEVVDSPTWVSLGVLKLPSPLPSRIEMPPEEKNAREKARSGTRSPLKSPTATAFGLGPTSTSVGLRKVPSPRPSRMEAVSEPPPELATTRSRFPSPLRSPEATSSGPSPTG